MCVKCDFREKQEKNLIKGGGRRDGEEFVEVDELICFFGI